MKQSKLLEFIRQWKSIERRQKDLDYERSRWCHDVRAEFGSGPSGDKLFCEWLAIELSLPPDRGAECLSRAEAFKIAPDSRTWDLLGGYRQIGKLVPLDKRERVAVIGAVQASGYRIETVLRQRNSKPVVSAGTPDIVLLAEFVESLDNVPEQLREIARHYVRARALKVA